MAVFEMEGTLYKLHGPLNVHNLSDWGLQSLIELTIVQVKQAPVKIHVNNNLPFTLFTGRHDMGALMLASHAQASDIRSLQDIQKIEIPCGYIVRFLMEDGFRQYVGPLTVENVQDLIVRTAGLDQRLVTASWALDIRKQAPPQQVQM